MSTRRVKPARPPMNRHAVAIRRVPLSSTRSPWLEYAIRCTLTSVLAPHHWNDKSKPGESPGRKALSLSRRPRDSRVVPFPRQDRSAAILIEKQMPLSGSAARAQAAPGCLVSERGLSAMKRRMLALLVITALLLSMMTVTASACHPEMTIDKRIESGSGPYKIGDTVTYSVTITNTGTEDLWNVTVTDALDSASPRNVGYIGKPYEEWVKKDGHWVRETRYNSVSYTYTHTVAEAERDARILTNTASATAKYWDGK